MSEIDWSRLKASEIRALAARNAIVIVPIGATEQHGPHLPSMVDWRCVHEVSHRAARIMEKTAAISTAKLYAKIGRTLDVIIDAVDDEGGRALLTLLGMPFKEN